MSSSCAFPAASPRLKRCGPCTRTARKGSGAARALGIAGVLAAVDKFWSDGLVLISAASNRFSSAALVSEVQRAVLGKAWIGPDRDDDLGPDVHRAPAPSPGCGCASACCWAARFAGPSSCPSCRIRRDHRHRLPRPRAVDALGRRLLHGRLGPAHLRPAMAEGRARVRRPRPDVLARRSSAADEMDAIETPTLLVRRSASSSRWSPWPGWRMPPSACPTGKACSP